MIFTANHLTDTDKQNNTQMQFGKSKQHKTQQNKTTLLPLTTLGQETRWAYSTTPRAHMFVAGQIPTKRCGSRSNAPSDQQSVSDSWLSCFF